MVKQIPQSRNIELVIAYRGEPFFGWQVQPNRRTVQGEINRAVKRITGQEIRSIGSSRTDTGVHAHDQHVSFQLTSTIPLDNLRYALNRLLPPEIRTLSVHNREMDFSARYHARAKHYGFCFFNSDPVTPFIAPMVWPYRSRLDEDLMAETAAEWQGTRCFKALQAGTDFRNETKTTIFHTDVIREGSLLCFHVLGRNFLYHMVRNMAGVLLMVGKGDWSVREATERMASGKRKNMAVTAPAKGLHLFKVYFEGPPYILSDQGMAFARSLAQFP